MHTLMSRGGQPGRGDPGQRDDMKPRGHVSGREVRHKGRKMGLIYCNSEAKSGFGDVQHSLTGEDRLWTQHEARRW